MAVVAGDLPRPERTAADLGGSAVLSETNLARA